MPKNETENIDCVEVKRRAQSEILKEIEGGSFKDELEALHRLAADSPIWKKLRKVKTPARSTKAPAKQRKTG